VGEDVWGNGMCILHRQSDHTFAGDPLEGMDAPTSLLLLLGACSVAVHGLWCPPIAPLPSAQYEALVNQVRLLLSFVELLC